MTRNSLLAGVLAIPLRLSVGFALIAPTIALAPSSAAAQSANLPIVRDAEIEALVRDYARPVLQAAGLSKSNVEIILVNDRRFNAFVAGRRIFVNTGALLMAEKPNEIIGVLAHEAGHIAGGHQERLRQQLERAQTMAIVTGLLGLGAVVAGAATNTSELAQAGAGVAAGGGELARRGLLSYQRTEETTADRSAITYLNATGQSAKGMLTTFKRFQTALSLSGARVDPYQVSHPVPQERIASLQTLAETSPYFAVVDSPELQLRHDLMRAKIAVFTQGQNAAAKLFRNDRTGLPAVYAEAMSAYLFGNPRTAVSKADTLIKAQPRNPYFYELRADSLMKANRPAEAAQSYAKAMSLDPVKSGMLQVSYGQALLATGTPEAMQKAVSELRKGLERDKQNVTGYQYLAQAYGRLGDEASAELALAEGHYYSGNYKDAKIFAARSQMKFKRGTPGWVRAQDIINYKTSSKKKK
ncbi:M48 family metalloprotease [Mesorhizobium sp. NBSH29]|uniref:M48 family metalloprotease n=1 Tax=Mesorhizobium sp. NBSH29 TaxID=2654249 RepID=UPI0018966043|nr:M48 family metalloprotease [Mesorhizobium sp. NBSH29]QPC87857.1 M48 family metalloprotease [Mesorhizobium sp. NBSH29]